MSYTLSSIDNKNIQWFANDNTRQSLTKIGLIKGRMRGLGHLWLQMAYPITAIAGPNGSGKSTLLALAACAFHNSDDGFTLAGRKVPYYTFSDFFIQSAGEVGPEGIEIHYYIRHNKWNGKEPGQQYQIRKKGKAGKWNNYDARVNRNVIYFGVQRVVPYFERSTHKSYRYHFKNGSLSLSTSNRIAELAGKIIGKSYSAFELLRYYKYSLPKVTANGLSYSGFNMGAGESAVLEILSTIFEAGPGCLLIVDEIELGLHPRAQIELIKVLKELCNEMKCQVICTTHSYEVLNSLPPSGRFFLDKTGGNIQVLPGISAEYACGKMGSIATKELDIFVEDEVAVSIMQTALDHELRTRCQVIEIGSHSSLKRVMASRFMETRRKCLCIMDGDQRNLTESIKSAISSHCDGKFALQKDEIQHWASERLNFMPGLEWPEKWLFEVAMECCDKVINSWNGSPAAAWGLSDDDVLRDLLGVSLQAGKHNEFPTLAKMLALPEADVRRELVTAIRRSVPAAFDSLAAHVRLLLG